MSDNNISGIKYDIRALLSKAIFVATFCKQPAKWYFQFGDYTLGKYLTQFENSFAKALKVKHAIGVNSGTDALKLALVALGVGHGDEVITAANTFIATVGAINETGAKPVLVDCTDDFRLIYHH